MTPRTRIAVLTIVLLVVLALPALACGLPDSGLEPPPYADPGIEHSAATAACSRLCGGDADCIHACLTR